MLDFVKDNLIMVISLSAFFAIFFYVYCGEIQGGITNKSAFNKKNINAENKDNEYKDNRQFIPSEKFIGKKFGFVFKMDKDGLGYYKDNMFKLV